jgi:Zn-dependent protease with chaperone function
VINAMSRRRLTGLRPQTYEHPLDAQALNALQKTSGLETVIRKCNEWGFERLLRVQLTGSHLRVTPDSVPDVHEKLLAACDLLDLPKVPDLYIASGDDLNAFTAGVERPLIVLNAGTVDRLTDDELLFVIAHEVGHIKSGHVLYYQIAEFLPVIGAIVGGATFGLGELLSAGLQVALLNWKRMSEFTADRAGLLASQDANVPITAMMKIAGLPQKYHGAINPEDFIAQAREFKALDADKLNWFVKALSTMGQTHPWTVMRASQFLAWVDGGEYATVLNADHALPPGIGGAPALPGAAFCTQCGRGLIPEARFCPGCGVAVSRASAPGNLQPS